MENKGQAFIYVTAAIIALLLTGLIFSFVTNNRTKKNLNKELLASEKLLSEKLSLDKKLGVLNDDFTRLTGDSKNNSKLLAEANRKLAENEKRINSINAENRSLRSARKDLAEMQKVKGTLENEVSQLKSDHEKLMAQFRDLKNSMTLLETERNNLASQLENTRNVNTDNFLVKATRGKKAENLVARASRTKNLVVTFEVPRTLTEAISFSILTPSGTTINPDDKAISYYFPQDSRTFTASLSALTGEFEQSRKVVLNFASPGKLTRGDYKIQIMYEGNNIGNCRISLK